MLLSPYRVLDLAQNHGMLRGQLLGELGADVIQVEPPGGAPGRRVVPFAGEREDPERSLSWCAYARAKHSMALTGDADRPPLRLSTPQAWCHAATEGFAGALAALHERHRSGSASTSRSRHNRRSPWQRRVTLSARPVNDSTVTRSPGSVIADGIHIRLTYPAADGHVSITHLFGASIGPATRRLMEYVFDDGFCDGATRDKDWIEYGLVPHIGRAPPRVGEHTRQDLDEIARIEPRRRKAAGLADLPALAGVKVLDFMWALAGPGATGAMADFGATVVRVESSTRLDVCRAIRPFINGDPSTELSAVFHTTNAGKRLLSLDLARPEAGDGVLDLVPAEPFAAYTDYIAPRFNLAAVLAALDHRRRTGEGPCIDLAQAEASMHFLTPPILGYWANGNSGDCIGNSDPQYSPHAVYPTDGDYTYIAIACETDGQWQSLCRVMPELGHPAVAAAADRLAQRSVLDTTLAEQTRRHEGRALEAALQEAAVPAAVVQNSPELIHDAQLLHLGHFVMLPHPEGLDTVIESGRIHLYRSPTVVDACAPTFGRDMMYVLQELLSYDDGRIGGLLVAGVFN